LAAVGEAQSSSEMQQPRKIHDLGMPGIVMIRHHGTLRLGGDEGLGSDPVRRLQGWPVTRATAEEWWTRARGAGEETWLRTHALPQEPEG
jgi:hypothetical protein